MGNKTEKKIETIGTLRLILDTGFIIDLVNTIYVLIFIRNLISFSRLDYYGYELKLANNRVFLLYNSCLIGFDTLCGNLYSLNLYCKYLLSLLFYHVHYFSKKQNQVNENSSILKHKRLGHISKERFERLVKNEILTSLDFFNFNSHVECIKRKYIEVFFLKKCLKGY